jgi:predicted membrane channel-forming protein YqfA (hemolysin III family)
MARFLKLCQFESYEEDCMYRYVVPRYMTNLDYVGISVLIAASILTVEYHGFYCQPVAQIAYMTSTTVLGIVGMCIPWLEWFDRQYPPLTLPF